MTEKDAKKIRRWCFANGFQAVRMGSSRLGVECEKGDMRLRCAADTLAPAGCAATPLHRNHGQPARLALEPGLHDSVDDFLLKLDAALL